MKTLTTKFSSKNILLLLLIFTFFQTNLLAKSPKHYTSFHPGKTWYDTSGKAINAHGGGVLFHQGKYYWYGEHKIPGKSEKQKADGGIHCYSSTDLMNWKDEGIVLSVDYENPESKISYGVILERPKVVYNKQSKKFIAYFKLYDKAHPYKVGYLGVATSDSPTGQFKYQHRTIACASPNGSGDFYMHIDDKGDLYHLSVRKPDKAFCITKMSRNYLHATKEVKVLEGITAHTEAPAGFTHNGKFFLLSSSSSGWSPNSARLFSSNKFDGKFEFHGNPCTGTNPHNNMNETKTFGGQSSFIIKVQGKKDFYIAMFDIWKPQMPIEGKYIWLPIKFGNGIPVIRWVDEWAIKW
jgi:hypothetical protein